MGEGENWFANMVAELLSAPSKCKGCPYGRQTRDGSYECYANECYWGEDEEEE